MFEQWIWLVPLLPWLAAAWIGLGFITGHIRGEKGEKLAAQAVLWSTALSLLLCLIIDVDALLNGVPGQVISGTWFESGSWRILISFTLDKPGLGLATLVALLSLLNTRFSINYLHREAAFQRFFMILSLFTGAMLLIVLAGNAVLAFVGWEIAGVSSYLLISYAFDRPVATDNAIRAFVTNKIGDAGFIFAIFTAFVAVGSTEWPDIESSVLTLDTLSAGMLLAGFLIAAMAKSGVIPFSGWVARALEGPTPSSAIFYGSLMVHAGVYLLIRLAPVFEHTPAMMTLLLLFGTVTMLYGWLSGLVQTDIKSSLMFSTTTQIGIMFMECGLGWFTLAAWHLALHAIWRAYQFLASPALMHLVNRPARPAPNWLTRHNRLYTAALQRFWLDGLTNLLLIKPTRSLADDVTSFDEDVITRLAGLPTSRTSASFSAMPIIESDTQSEQASAYTESVGKGQGFIGTLMQKIAEALQWFEEKLVLSGGGQSLSRPLKQAGRYLTQIEKLLSQPRYLLLIVMASLVFIL